MVGDDENDEDKDRGELKYQESKIFNSEWFMCSAYDNIKTRRVYFEVYGMDTQDMFHKAYDYTAFDGLFRFNAELMNPNRKEGRFHWIIERLALQRINKKTELKLLPEPTPEVPELPIYELHRKIPTGRMDMKERQKLREQMDMLDISRAENIAKKRAATRQRVLKHIISLKEEDKRRKEAVNANIEEERKLRYRMKEEQERKDRDDEAKMEQMRKQRRKAVEVKEERTEEQDEEEYRQLRARWRVKDAEKAQILADMRARKLKEREEKAAADQRRQERLADIASRRASAIESRDRRVKKKQEGQIKAILEVRQERERKAKLAKERNNEYLQNLHMERQPVFKAQLERTARRRTALESEQEALANYKEHRAIPKRVNKKAARGKDKKDKDTPKAKSKSPAKAKKGTEKESEAEGTGTEAEKEKPQGKAIDPDKVLDAVEAKMRKEMEEDRRREMKDKKRAKKITERTQAWITKENEHNGQVREAYRQNVTLKDQAEVERRIILKQKREEEMAAAERKKAERERLDRVRAGNILRREQERLQALTA